jgi:hypothetical protein
MRSRFSVSAKWAWSWASWAWRWAYWRALFVVVVVGVIVVEDVNAGGGGCGWLAGCGILSFFRGGEEEEVN